MAEQKGTGKHPHKSTEEPFPHTKVKRAGGGAGGEQAEAEESPRSEEDTADERSREYRDAEGNIHHHTRTYMEQHKGEKQEKK